MNNHKFNFNIQFNLQSHMKKYFVCSMSFPLLYLFLQFSCTL